MSNLMTASNQWAQRPDDERFTSLLELLAHCEDIRGRSRGVTVPTSQITVRPIGEDHKGIEVAGPTGNGYVPTHWAFGQLAALAESPAGYLRSGLESEIVADCLNSKLRKRSIEDIGLLLHKNGSNVLRAATGPRYGRIWNDDVVRPLVENFGDGVTGDWRVPGEFGKAVDVTKANTTLYAGDRDMFVFLADESRRIEMPDRRDGKSGALARGFFVWNSEVGSSTFGIGTFLFDYVCCNRIVWGAEGYVEVKMRHTVSAPDRFFREILPALETFKRASDHNIVRAIAAAKEAHLKDTVDAFVASRFSAKLVDKFKAVHMLEEQRPIETVFDVVTAATAHARSIPWQGDRVAMERIAGEVLRLPVAA